MGLKELTIEEFEAALQEYDDAVDQTGALGTDLSPEIDVACSSSDWLLPSMAVWAVDREPWIRRSDAGFIVLTRSDDADGATVLLPPDSMWGFASPIIGGQPELLVDQLGEALLEDPSWDLVLLTGLAPDGLVETAVRSRLQDRFTLYAGPTMTRCRIDIPSFRDHETSKQRRERRRIANRCAEQGVDIIDPLADQDPTLQDIFARIVDVEARSWKGLEGSGIIEPTLQGFYRRMLDRVGIDRLRVLFARVDGEDVGYILGHMRGQEYRGLQISYAASHRHLSLGSLLQSAEIERSERTGIRSYDLGMDMAYKQRWSTHGFTTRTTAIAQGRRN